MMSSGPQGNFNLNYEPKAKVTTQCMHVSWDMK